MMRANAFSVMRGGDALFPNVFGENLLIVNKQSELSFPVTQGMLHFIGKIVEITYLHSLH